MRALVVLALSAGLWWLALDELAHQPVTNSGSQPYVRPIGSPGPPLPP